MSGRPRHASHMPCAYSNHTLPTQYIKQQEGGAQQPPSNVRAATSCQSHALCSTSITRAPRGISAAGRWRPAAAHTVMSGRPRHPNRLNLRC
eukprot:1138711-Pelagomonas_calceolata.AAC.1